MAIPIVEEPLDLSSFFSELEACCFCHQPTSFWTAILRRTAGQQVACCPGCAGIFPVSLVPTKNEWFDYHAAQTRAREGM